LKYLDNIFASLKAGGLVKAIRGAKGGYVLNKPLEDINVGQIIEVLEGPLELVECIHNQDYCGRMKSCVMRDLWSEVSRDMKLVLKRTTLEGLIEREKSKNKVTDKMYYI
jgi:Rrf2 family transcriptional regulator, cysteine metabolism repressor